MFLCGVSGHMAYKHVAQSSKASVLKHLDPRLKFLVEGSIWHLSTSTRLQRRPGGMDPVRQQVAQQMTGTQDVELVLRCSGD